MKKNDDKECGQMRNRVALKGKNGITVWLPEDKEQEFIEAQSDPEKRLSPEEKARLKAEIKALLRKDAGL